MIEGIIGAAVGLFALMMIVVKLNALNEYYVVGRFERQFSSGIERFLVLRREGSNKLRTMRISSGQYIDVKNGEIFYLKN